VWTVKITFEAIVPLGAEEAFAFVSDPSNWPKFSLQLESVEKGEDWGRVGGHTRFTNRILGRSVTSDRELTEWDPPRMFRYTMRQPGKPDVDKPAGVRCCGRWNPTDGDDHGGAAWWAGWPG
jgi:hypothetical protein